ncbi:MAG: PadR family transcriptional regulator [Candidatus Eremiobacteraeota bacterium]|nr:PadR family transcriptional regulator [Candidatus Eremiobacteraeota bacterium]
MPPDIDDVLPLTVGSFHILLALAQGERHGYAIAKEVESTTLRRVRLGPTTLYRTIRQLLADGWIAEVTRVDEGDARKRLYRLTSRGRTIAAAEAQRLADLVRIARERRLVPTLA